MPDFDSERNECVGKRVHRTPLVEGRGFHPLMRLYFLKRISVLNLRHCRNFRWFEHCRKRKETCFTHLCRTRSHQGRQLQNAKRAVCKTFLPPLVIRIGRKCAKEIHFSLHIYRFIQLWWKDVTDFKVWLEEFRSYGDHFVFCMILIIGSKGPRTLRVHLASSRHLGIQNSRLQISLHPTSCVPYM